VLRFGFG